MDRVTKEELLRRIRNERQEFDATLARVPHERLTEPLLPGGWSIKDVMAHIAWGDREAIGVVEARALVGSDLWELSEDERNDAVVLDSRSRSLEHVLDEYRASFHEFLAAIDRLSDEDLNDPARLAGLSYRIPGWLPWRVLYDPGHYREHRQTIEASGLISPRAGRSRPGC